MLLCLCLKKIFLGGDFLNKYALKEVVDKNNDTLQNLANYLGIHVNTLYEKIKAKKYDFTRDQIFKIKERYNLTAEQIDSIFFN
jgi:hypothetical protein